MRNRFAIILPVVITVVIIPSQYIGSPELLTLVPLSFIAPYHKEQRLRILMGVVQDIN